MGNLGLEDIPASLERALRQLREHPIAEAARRGDPLAREPGVLEDLECIGDVFGELIGADLPTLQPQFSMNSDVRSGYGRPVLVSITQVWLTISGWMSQLGVIKLRTSSRLASSSCLDQPGKSRSSQPTQAGYGTRLYFPLIPRSAHHSPNRRTNASGISRGRVFHGW